jgi:hypothetical protein
MRNANRTLAEADTFARAPGAAHRLGAWNGQALTLSREAWGGAKATEALSLADSGATRVSVVHMQGGIMGDRTMRRVDRRVSEP